MNDHLYPNDSTNNNGGDTLPTFGTPPPLGHTPPSPSLLNLLTLYRDGLRKLADSCQDSDAVLYAELRLAASHMTAAIRHIEAKEWERLEQEEREAALENGGDS